MTQRERVYTMLEQAGREGVTNGQFVDAHILRYSARIKELRDIGHRIEKHRITDGTFRYTLHSGKQPSLSSEGAGEPGIRDAPETGSRGSSRRMECLPASQRQPAAAIAGSGDQDTQGGGGSRAAAALPTLFELPRSGSAGHYGEAA
jgi:hypothetical protein